MGQGRKVDCGAFWRVVLRTHCCFSLLSFFSTLLDTPWPVFGNFTSTVYVNLDYTLTQRQKPRKYPSE